MVGGAVGLPPGGGGGGGDVDSSGLEAFAGYDLFEVGGRGAKVEPADFVEAAVATSVQDADAFGDGVLDDAAENHGGAVLDKRTKPEEDGRKEDKGKDGEQAFPKTSTKLAAAVHR